MFCPNCTTLLVYKCVTDVIQPSNSVSRLNINIISSFFNVVIFLYHLPHQLSNTIYNQSSFELLGLHPDLARSIEECGWELPRDVQDEAIPIILGGNDVMIASETGSGKTGALVLPMLQLINEYDTAMNTMNKTTIHTIPILSKYTPESVGLNRSDSVDNQYWHFSTPRSLTTDQFTQTRTDASLPDPYICGDIITAKWTNHGFWGGVKANVGACSGKYYFETTILSGQTIRIGMTTKSGSYESGCDHNGIGWGSTGVIVYGKQFIQLQPQQCIDCGSLNDPTGISANTGTDMNTASQRALVMFAIGDTIGFAVNYVENEVILYKISKPTKNQSASRTVTRVGIVKSPFYRGIYYFPTFCTKDGSFSVNFHGNFVNSALFNQDNGNSSEFGYKPYSHCVFNNIYVNNSSTDMNDNLTVANAGNAHNLSQLAVNSNIKAIVIAPSPELCLQIHTQLSSLSKYLSPRITFELCSSRNDLKKTSLYTAEIIIGTIGFLEILFGTHILNNNGQQNKNVDIAQNGVYILPQSQSQVDMTRLTDEKNSDTFPTPPLNFEHGPSLANCLFFAIDEADAFVERFNSDILFRMFCRIKRDKDRLFTSQHLQYLERQQLNDSSDNQHHPFEIKCSRAQVILCSATLDPEKMSLLHPILKDNFSTIHLRERYELPKGLLQGVIYLHSGKLIQKYIKYFQELAEKTQITRNQQQNADKSTSNEKIVFKYDDFVKHFALSPENPTQNWSALPLHHKFVDYIHEYGMPLENENNFLQHIYQLTQECKKNGDSTSMASLAFIPLITTQFGLIQNTVQYDYLISLCVKQYKLYVLGYILTQLTKIPSKHLNNIHNYNNIIKSIDFSHLTCDQSSTTSDYTYTNITDRQNHHNTTISADDHGIHKVLIFCRTQNDCMRTALYLSALVNSGLLVFPNIPHAFGGQGGNNSMSNVDNTPPNNKKKETKYDQQTKPTRSIPPS